MGRIATSPSRAISSGPVMCSFRLLWPVLWPPVRWRVAARGTRRQPGWQSTTNPTPALPAGCRIHAMHAPRVPRTAGVGAAGLESPGCGRVRGRWQNFAFREPDGRQVPPGPQEGPAGSTGRPRSHRHVHVRELAALHRSRQGQRRAGQPVPRLFTQETDIDVHYVEVIQAYDEFFAKLHVLLERSSPPLRPDRHGLPQVVADDGERPPDPARCSKPPNFAANAASKYHDPPYDPGNQFSILYMWGSRGSATTLS